MTNTIQSYNRLKHDARLVWRPGRIYIPASQFSGLDYETTTATDIKSMGTGAANDTAITEINTSGIVALNMGANANSVEHLLAVPSDIDLAQPIYFSVVWTANNTSGTATMAVTYKPYIKDTTVLGSAVSATALSTAITAKTMAGVAFTLMVTDEGKLNGGVLPETTEYLQLGVIRSAVTTITLVSFLGLNIRYTPRRLWGPDGMGHEAKAPTYIAGKTYAN
jgi:hypothetical protein